GGPGGSGVDHAEHADFAAGEALLEGRGRFELAWGGFEILPLRGAGRPVGASPAAPYAGRHLENGLVSEGGAVAEARGGDGDVGRRGEIGEPGGGFGGVATRDNEPVKTEFLRSDDGGVAVGVCGDEGGAGLELVAAPILETPLDALLADGAAADP